MKLWMMTPLLDAQRRGGRGGTGLFDQLTGWVVHAVIWRVVGRLPMAILLVVLVVGVAVMWWHRRAR